MQSTMISLIAQGHAHSTHYARSLQMTSRASRSDSDFETEFKRRLALPSNLQRELQADEVAYPAAVLAFWRVVR